MLTLNQLKPLVKKQIIQTFPEKFEIGIRHPNPTYRCSEDTNFYYVNISYVTNKKIVEMFGKHFEIKNLKMDFRKVSTWVEIQLLVTNRKEYKKNGKAITRSNFEKQQELKKQQIEMLTNEMKKINKSIKPGIDTYLEVGNYCQVYNILGAGKELEIRIGAVHPNVFMHQWDTSRYEHLKETFGTFAIASKKGLNTVTILEKHLSLEDLMEKLPGYIEEFKNKKAA